MCPPCPSQALLLPAEPPHSPGLQARGSGRRKVPQNQGVILGTITKVTEAERTGEQGREAACQTRAEPCWAQTSFPSGLPIWGPLYPHPLPTGLKVPQTRSCLKPNAFPHPNRVRGPQHSHVPTENNCRSSRKQNILILTPKAELSILSERQVGAEVLRTLPLSPCPSGFLWQTGHGRRSTEVGVGIPGLGPSPSVTLCSSDTSPFQLGGRCTACKGPHSCPVYSSGARLRKPPCQSHALAPARLQTWRADAEIGPSAGPLLGNLTPLPLTHKLALTVFQGKC